MPELLEWRWVAKDFQGSPSTKVGLTGDPKRTATKATEKDTSCCGATGQLCGQTLLGHMMQLSPASFKHVKGPTFADSVPRLTLNSSRLAGRVLGLAPPIAA